MPIPRPAAALAFIAAAFVGAYICPYTLSRNGLGDSITRYIMDEPYEGLPGAPKPLVRSFLGVGFIDDLLGLVVGFFSALLDGDISPQNRLYTIWGMSQFAASYSLLVIEGMRIGNHPTLLSWVPVMMLLVQWGSWTFVLPLWLAMHVLRSPIARLSPTSKESARALMVDKWNLHAIPWNVTFSFIVPYILMSLPPSVMPTTLHYWTIAVWQLFPMWGTFVQVLFSDLIRSAAEVDRPGGVSKSTSIGEYLEASRGVYRFAIILAAAAQVVILNFVAGPPATRDLIASLVPGLRPFTAPDVTIASVFWPHSPLDPPTVEPAALESGGLAPLAVYFFQYDIYIAGAAMVLWAVVLQVNASKQPNYGALATRVLLFMALGGPAAATAAVLMKRDLVLEEEKIEVEVPVEDKKTK